MKLRRGQTTDILLWVLVGLGVAAAVGIAIFLLMPKEQYIEADGVKIYKLPPDAEQVFVDMTQSKNVGQLAREGKAYIFVGYDSGLGLPIEVEKAKIRAYASIAEFLEARVSTFAQLVEGQLKNVQVSGKEQEIRSAALDAYKRVTALLANATISGARLYASWKVRRNNAVETYVLLVYDPMSIMRIVEANKEVSGVVSELGRQGVDFFKSLNDVMKEALKGTPLEQK